MKTKDQAILLRKINYSETSLILTLLCRQSGLRTFIFQGGKKKHGNILQPLTLLEIEFYERPGSDLAKISAASPEFVFTSIHSHPYKSATAFYLAELLYNVTKQESEQEEDFFLFLAAEIHELDLAPFEANYPLWFTTELTKWIGIEPQVNSSDAVFFYPDEGIIADRAESTSGNYETGEHIRIVSRFFSAPKDIVLQYSLNGKIRNRLLRLMLRYYAIHINGFHFPKSVEVLEEVFND